MHGWYEPERLLSAVNQRHDETTPARRYAYATPHGAQGGPSCLVATISDLRRGMSSGLGRLASQLMSERYELTRWRARVIWDGIGRHARAVMGMRDASPAGTRHLDLHI